MREGRDPARSAFSYVEGYPALVTRPSPLTQNRDTCRRHHDQPHQQDYGERYEHHQSRLAGRGGVHLPETNNREVKAVQRYQGTYDRYPVDEARDLGVGGHPEGGAETRVALTNDEPYQQLLDRSHDEEADGASYGREYYPQERRAWGEDRREGVLRVGVEAG